MSLAKQASNTTSATPPGDRFRGRVTVGEQAIDSLKPLDSTVVAHRAASDRALVGLRGQIRELQDELRDLERRTRAIDATFGDLAERDPSDPFVGDTPATTSEHIAALADLETPESAPVERAGPPEPSSEPIAVAEAGTGEAFWGEQEQASRARWMRPVEVVVPMVMALLLFVVLMLWVG